MLSVDETNKQEKVRKIGRYEGRPNNVNSQSSYPHTLLSSYKQALQEIKEIADYIMESDIDNWNVVEPFEKIDEIRQKISEVLDEQ